LYCARYHAPPSSRAWMEAEQRRHDENAAVAILDIRHMNEGVHQ
jgi:hypothetical protein